MKCVNIINLEMLSKLDMLRAALEFLFSGSDQDVIDIHTFGQLQDILNMRDNVLDLQAFQCNL